MAKSRKHKKRSTKRIAKARAGSLTCHITKRARSFVLACPNVAPIKLGIGLVGVKFAPKGVARAAKAAKSGGTVVANSAGQATTMATRLKELRGY